MNRAYQIHLEQIEAHDASHPSTLAVEVQQIVNPDLSCIVCYPPVHYFRAFRTFWNRYQPAYLLLAILNKLLLIIIHSESLILITQLELLLETLFLVVAIIILNLTPLKLLLPSSEDTPDTLFDLPYLLISKETLLIYILKPLLKPLLFNPHE